MFQSFRKDQRVIRSDEFTRIIKRGSCASDATLVLFAVSGGNPSVSRLGITIPKRTGKAVQRNRWKRLIRESFRTQQDAIPQGYDFVVRPKKNARATWEQVQDSLPKLAVKAVRKLPS